MSIQQLAQRFAELEWPTVYLPLRIKLVEETVANIESGHVTRAEVEAMIQEMENRA